MRPQVRLAVKVVVCIRLLFVTTRIVVVVVAAATTMAHRRGVVFSTVPRRRTLFAMITTSLPNNSKVVSTHEQRVPSQIVVAAHTRMRDTSTSGGLCSSRSSLRTLNWNRRTIERVRTTMSSSTYSSLPSSTDASLSSLFGDEKFAYAELTALSKRIRALDESYYGANDDDDDDDDGTTNSSESKLSDDEYDALARREAELCIAYPHLQVMLERKTGLGSSATRYGGRVGRIIIVDNDETSTIEEEMPTSKTTTTKKKKTTSSRTKSTTPKRIKRQHLVNAPMLSLDNAMNDMEAISWLNRVRNLLVKEEALDIATSNSNAAIINDDTRDNTTTTPQTTSIKMMTTTRTMQILAEPKIDGLGLSLRYRLGDNDNKGDCNIYHFIWGATRGDGTKGEDVTEAVRSAWMMMMGEESHDNSIHSVPYSFAIPKAWNYSAGQQRQQPPYELEIRGEVVLPKKAFADLFLDRTIVVDTTDNDSISSSSSTTPTFSNARNAASGILLRSKDSEDSAEAEQTKYLRSQLRFYAYDFVASPSIEENDVNMSSTIGNDGIEMRDKLTSLGFCVPSPVVLESIEITAGVELDVSNISNLIRYHHNLMAARDGNNTTVVTAAAAEHVFPFQIDGVVYKLSSFNDRRICGSSSRAPRWAIAHKFPSTSAVTRLLDIEVQVGRTGALTPVAIFEPVSLSGVMVSRASLHNFHFARKLLLPKKSLDLLLVDDKGSIGVKKGISLLVGRAGDVIPQVKKRIFDDDHDDDDNNIAGLHSSEMISLKDPHLCPACGSPATFDFVTANTTTIKRQKKASSQAVGTDEDKSVDEDKSIDTEVSGQVLRCSGPQLLCPPRAVNGLAYAYSKAGLDVKGLSKAKIGQLMEGGIIRFPADLFAIYGGATDNSSAKHDVSGKIADIPGWGELSSQNVAESIRSVATEGVPLSKYIYSLGIPQVGMHASQLVASKYRSVGTFLKAVQEASLYEFTGKADMNGVEREEVITPFASLTGLNGSKKVKGIGPTAISALIAFSRTEVLVKAAKDLAAVLTVHNDDSVNSSDTKNVVIDGTINSPFYGMTVVFTGSLPGMSRTMAQHAVKALGAKSTPNTISKSTSLVVHGDQEGLSKKLQKAHELGICVINYTKFIRLIESVKIGS